MWVNLLGAARLSQGDDEREEVSTMRMRGQAGRAALTGAALAILVAACGGDSDDDPSEAAPVQQTTTPAAQETPADTRLPEGTYQTAPLSIDQLVDTATAAGFDRAEVEASLSSLGYADAATVTYTLKLEGGRWTEFESVDGGPAEIGWSGTYEVIDEDTVVATDPCGSITYTYRLDGNELTIDMVEDECQGLGESRTGELIAQTTIYETAPFTKLE